MNDQTTNTERDQLRRAIATDLTAAVLPEGIFRHSRRLLPIEAEHIARLMTDSASPVGALLAERERARERDLENAVTMLEQSYNLLAAVEKVEEEFTDALAFAALGWAWWLAEPGPADKFETEGERTMFFEDNEFPEWLREGIEVALTSLRNYVAEAETAINSEADECPAMVCACKDRAAAAAAAAEEPQDSEPDPQELYNLAVEGWASYLLLELGNSWRTYTPEQRQGVYNEHDLPGWLRDGIEVNEFSEEDKPVESIEIPLLGGYVLTLDSNGISVKSHLAAR